jgi:hypothetical protein
MLSETLRVDDLAGDLEAREDIPRRLQVLFSHVGVFTEPELTLFYGLTPTDRLLRVHADVARIYRRCTSTIMARTQPGVWVPHCTLATQLDSGRLSDAGAAAASLALPWVVPQVRLAIVRFDPERVEVLRVLAGQGAPARRRRYPIRRAGG